MKLIDSHCHLYFDEFNTDRDQVLSLAQEKGVVAMMNVGTEPVTNEAVWQMAQSHPGVLFHSAGLHPHHSHQIDEKGLEDIRMNLDLKKPLAIGEIGLDYYKCPAPADVQKNRFTRMLEWALEMDLPVIIHSRDAFNDTFECLKNVGGGKLRGVMHCYSYDLEALKKILDLGFYVSFACNITYKKSTPLLDVAKNVPLDRLLLETDSPYLAPQIIRGKRNDPSYVAHLAQFLADERKIAVERLAQSTYENTAQLFKLPLKK